MGSFAPDGHLRQAMCLKDGLLGAAIGWHLTKKGIRFWHAHCVKGTETDFILQTQSGQLLVECKILSVSINEKQLARNIRDSLKQLDEHATLLQGAGWQLVDSVCVVNLTNADLESVRHSGFPLGNNVDNLLSYEQFAKWLHRQLRQKSQSDRILTHRNLDNFEAVEASAYQVAQHVQ